MAQQTKAQLKTELRLLRQNHRLHTTITIGRTLIRSAAVVVIVYIIGDTIKTLAGKTTIADIMIGIFSNIRINTTISWSVAGVASIWAIYERQLRRKKTKYMAERIQKLESSKDAKRSSSKLTEHGDTNPKDR